MAALPIEMVEAGDNWTSAYVGVGANLDTPSDQVDEAIMQLCEIDAVRIFATSAKYRTAPVGPGDQRDYCNAVVALMTTLGASGLLAALQSIEQAMGRVRDGDRWGPRVIDLDLLHVPGVAMQDDALTLPHPRILERAFVLIPWADVAPKLVLHDGRTVAWHAASIDSTGVSDWLVATDENT
ncbi:MAG: 2-amino-4-hydroxy-6-hydroxymethyldihydropteridine diphosphokinase [Pseudomonadota bacterium]